MTSHASLPQILKALKSSPLSQLSLCSKELFHSNFLAWLCDNYPEIGRLVFGDFLTTQPIPAINAVEREEKNIDLWLKFEDGQGLIIENKIKSIPAATQLSDYSKKVGTDQTSFLLLSLSRPTFLSTSQEQFKDANGCQWHYLDYGNLAERLRSILEKGVGVPAPQTYHRQIIEDYIVYIEALDQLHDHFSLENDPGSCFFEPSLIPQDLQESRFYHGVVKMRHAQLASMLTEKLSELKFEIVSDQSSFWQSPSGSVLTTSGLTRATGLVDFKFSLLGSEHTSCPVTLGVQLQGDQFRLVVERRGKSALEAANLFKTASGTEPCWFDFSHLRLPSKNQEFPAKRDFNKFGEVFLYRSKRLGRNIPATAIVDAIAAYALLARDNADYFRDRVINIA